LLSLRTYGLQSTKHVHRTAWQTSTSEHESFQQSPL
jgi:hypothetical protein